MTGWSGPELDLEAAQALALFTLVAGEGGPDLEAAGRMLDELLARPAGADGLIGGLVSVAAGLLVLLEHRGGVPADDALAHLGVLIAAASVAS